MFPAKWQAITINGAIALQIILGALTTGAAAAGSQAVRSLLLSLPLDKRF